MNILKVVAKAVGGLPGELISNVLLGSLGRSKNKKISDAAKNLKGIIDSSDEHKHEIKLAEIDLKKEMQKRLLADIELQQREYDLEEKDIDRQIVETQHESFWVYGARPFLLWIVNFSMLVNYVVFPILTFFFKDKAYVLINLPSEVYYFYGSVFLGVSGMRSYEKMKKLGVNLNPKIIKRKGE